MEGQGTKDVMLSQLDKRQWRLRKVKTFSISLSLSQLNDGHSSLLYIILFFPTQSVFKISLNHVP